MLTKVHIIKAVVFPVAMYGCESWTMKKAECQRIDAFELWCWRRLSRVPLDCKEIKLVHPKGNQSWIFIGRLMLKLKLQYFGHLIQRAYSLEKTLMLGKTEGRRKKRWQRMRMVGWHQWLNGHEFQQTPRDTEGQGSLVCCSSWGHKDLDTT